MAATVRLRRAVWLFLALFISTVAISVGEVWQACRWRTDSDGVSTGGRKHAWKPAAGSLC
jgi:hypothetical protein